MWHAVFVVAGTLDNNEIYVFVDCCGIDPDGEPFASHLHRCNIAGVNTSLTIYNVAFVAVIAFNDGEAGHTTTTSSKLSLYHNFSLFYKCIMNPFHLSTSNDLPLTKLSCRKTPINTTEDFLKPSTCHLWPYSISSMTRNSNPTTPLSWPGGI